MSQMSTNGQTPAKATPVQLATMSGYSKDVTRPENMAVLESLLTPHGVSVQEFVQQAVIELDAIATGPKAKRLTKASVASTICNCAYLGLTFGNSRKQAYMVPFKNGAVSRAASRNSGEDIDVHDLQLVVGYHGYIELAYRSGFLRSIHGEVILEGEEWSRWVDENGPHFRHDIPELRAIPTRENVRGAYVVWENRHGVHGHQFVTLAEINKVYNGKSDAWRNEFASQAMKTAVRRAERWWHVGTLSHQAAYLEAQRERGDSQGDLTVGMSFGDDAPPPMIGDEPDEPEQSERYDHWSDRLANGGAGRVEEMAHEIKAECASGDLTEEERDKLLQYAASRLKQQEESDGE